eukprot:jgi/Mesvir1/28060/Mv04658-RA.2
MMDVLPFLSSIPADFQGKEVNYIRDLVEFLREYQWLFRCHVVDFFVDKHWKNMDPEWLESLRTATMADLLDMPSGIYKNEWPSTLQRFVAQARRLTLTREPAATSAATPPVAAPPSAGVMPPLPLGGSLPVPRPIGRVLAQGMSPKKKHEVARLAALVAAVASATQAKLVLDMGAGQGYLSQILSYQYGLRTVAIDSCADHASVVNRRGARILRHLRNCLSRAQASVTVQSHPHGSKAGPAHGNAPGGAATAAGDHVALSGAVPSSKNSDTCAPSSDRGAGLAVTDASGQGQGRMGPGEAAAEGGSGRGEGGTPREAAAGTGTGPPLDFSPALRGVHAVTLAIRPSMGGKELASALQSGLVAGAVASGTRSLDHPKHVGDDTRSIVSATEDVPAAGSVANASSGDFDGLPQDVVKEIASGGPVLLVGLHACGDLSATMIRMALEWPSVAAIINVGCCYNLLSEPAPMDKESLRDQRVRRATQLLAQRSSTSSNGCGTTTPATPGGGPAPAAGLDEHTDEASSQARESQAGEAACSGGARDENVETGARMRCSSSCATADGALCAQAEENGANGRTSPCGAHRCGRDAAAPPDLEAREEEPAALPGFPMSQLVKASGLFHLGNDARALACQSAEKCFHECPAWAAGKIQHHEFRAGLQLVLWRYCPQLFLDQDLSLAVRPSFRCPHMPPKRSSCQCRAHRAGANQAASTAAPCKMAGAPLCDASCFIDYVRGALAGAGVAAENIPPDDEVAEIWQSTRDEAALVAPFWMLRIVLAGVLESLILVDRLLFTWERGRELQVAPASDEAPSSCARQGMGSILMPLFDPSQSPRNMAIVAWRS